MEQWVVYLLFLTGVFIILLLIGMPVAFSLLGTALLAAFLLMGGTIGFVQILHNLRASVANYRWVPVSMFILMGEVTFRSGVASRILDSIDKWMGRVPGRLGLLAVAGGATFSVLTGSSMASIALLGSVLTPEMEKRGYRKSISLGSILGGGSLAIMIPPSSLAIVVAVLAQVSVARFLMAIIIPGVVMGIIYAAYIIIRCSLQPSLAPPYKVVDLASLREKVMGTVQSILPLVVIVFSVTGVIFMGMATPSEAAATGAVACFVVAVAFRGLNWKIFKEIVRATLQTTGMVLLIFGGAAVFSQVLAYSGASRGIAELATGLPVSPIVLLIIMQLIIVLMGMFMEPVSIIMVTFPIYLPIVHAVGFDPIWFAVIILLNAEIAATSPPFGLCLYVMKGVAPPDTTMGDVYRATIPFNLMDLLVMGLIMAFPMLVLWLPELMRPLH